MYVGSCKYINTYKSKQTNIHIYTYIYIHIYIYTYVYIHIHPFSMKKIPIIEPIVKIKEPVSTLSLSTQPQIVIPIVDNKFNQLQTNNVKIEAVKSKNVDMIYTYKSDFIQ